MLTGIMIFLNRHAELARLDRLMALPEGGLAVVYGRRRIGKTRLLVEWASRHGGLYSVADQSAPELQRRYFAQTLAQRLPGFADVDYPDWFSLLARLARDAAASGWRGPLVFDELPYAVAAAPELPSLLQRFVDHEARQARLVIALAGSSQRMMQGLVLDANAPLYGRSRATLEIGPLPPVHLGEVFGVEPGLELADLYTAWGGVPRYWELALEAGAKARTQVLDLVLDPLGTLHQEPERLLLEELPSALDLRPILDVIGAGAHRVSEIAGRLGRQATSMSRPLERLLGMGIVRREVPFGESEKESRRSLYEIADPFFRLWFRVVAPNRALLTAGTAEARRNLLDRCWPELAAQAFEELCRRLVPQLGEWNVAARWWQGNAPEWDLLAESLDGRSLLLGEVKWSARPFGRTALDKALAELASRSEPPLGSRWENRRRRRILFVPALAAGVTTAPAGEIAVLTLADLLGSGAPQQKGAGEGEQGG